MVSNNYIINKTIVGTWVSGESGEKQSTWKITKYKDTGQPGPKDINPHDIGDKLYRLEHIQNRDTIIFDLYLLKLGDYLYFDVWKWKGNIKYL